MPLKGPMAKMTSAANSAHKTAMIAVVRYGKLGLSSAATVVACKRRAVFARRCQQLADERRAVAASAIARIGPHGFPFGIDDPAIGQDIFEPSRGLVVRQALLLRRIGRADLHDLDSHRHLVVVDRAGVFQQFRADGREFLKRHREGLSGMRLPVDHAHQCQAVAIREGKQDVAMLRQCGSFRDRAWLEAALGDVLLGQIAAEGFGVGLPGRGGGARVKRVGHPQPPEIGSRID